jgi:sugar phosphate isomerase/epimerase
MIRVTGLSSSDWRTISGHILPLHLSTVDRVSCPADAKHPMLRLAFSAWAMRELPLAVQIEIVRRAGYVGICLVSDPRFEPLDALRTSAAERRDLRAALNRAGLVLTAIAGHANLLEPDPRQSMERIRAGLDLAEPNGPPPLITMGYGTPDTYSTDRTDLAERFAQLAEHAAKTGGVLALEPHVGQAMDQPEKIVRLMNTVASRRFRVATLVRAAERAGVALEHRGAGVGAV